MRNIKFYFNSFKVGLTNPDRESIATEVTIFDNQVCVASGLTYLGKKDKHDAVLAQKFAVRFAIDNFIPRESLEHRKRIWEAFFNHSRRTQKLKTRKRK